MSKIVAVSYGGGTNSVAMVCLAIERGERPDIIAFADTGSEMPHTMRHIETMGPFLHRHGFPPISVVRWIRVKAPHAGKFIPLHEWCEDNQTVPSRAFNLSGCTVKWKQQPLERFIGSRPLVLAAHEAGDRVERWIGYDAGEPERAERMIAKNVEPERWIWRTPLVEHDLDRDGCIDLIRRHGLPLPGKSSCWMCPSMKKHEIDQLGRDYPELLERALRMERGATFTKQAGLGGGSLNWNRYIMTREGSDRANETPCGCYDGE